MTVDTPALEYACSLRILELSVRREMWLQRTMVVEGLRQTRRQETIARLWPKTPIAQLFHEEYVP